MKKAAERRGAGSRFINRIALCSSRKNRSHSILIMVSVFLSTVLLTMISSYGLGLVRYERAYAEEQYGTYHGMFMDISSDQQDAVRKNSVFTDIGIMYDCGEVKSDDSISLTAMDDTAAGLCGTDRMIKEGSMPEQENEIAADRGMLRSLGYADAVVGDSIRLSFRPDLKSRYQEKTLRLSGILGSASSDQGDHEAGSCRGIVSPSFYSRYCETDDSLCNVVFRMTEDTGLDSGNAQDVITGYAEQCGIKSSQVSVNTMYILLVLSPGHEIILVCAGLILFVVLFSMIVVYNIFQVSLVQRMHEYGRIKAAGASGRQIRRIISREGMILALPAVPAGAAAGYMAAYLSFGWLVDTVGVIQGRADVDFAFFSPAAVIGSGLLAFATVWLAMVRPKRTIARISAVEAMGYREGAQPGGSQRRKGRRKSRQAGMRRGRAEVSELSLAFANIASDRRHAVMTMMTMGLTCVMFVVMANCLGNIDTEFEARKDVPHGQFEIALDYTFYDEAYPENNLDSILKKDPIDSELLEKLRAVDGVTSVQTRDILVSDMDGQLDSVDVLSREDFEKACREGAVKGDPDYDDASEENQMIYGWSAFLEDTGMKPGDRLETVLSDGSGSRKLSSALGGAFGHCDTGWAITEETYRALGFVPGDSPGRVWIDCSDEDVPQVEKSIREIIAGEKHMDIRSLQQSRREQDFSAVMVKYAIYMLLAAVGIIGFANLANTMIINITTKRREYGIMQATGMTGRQLARSLTYQGLVYTGGTLAVSAALGIPLGYLAFRWCCRSAIFGMNVYHFPWVEILLMTAVLVLMQLGLSWLLSRNLSRESLVERIRI